MNEDIQRYKKNGVIQSNDKIHPDRYPSWMSSD